MTEESTQKPFAVESEPTPKPISVYHYTSKTNYERILNGWSDGLIKDPRSDEYVKSEQAIGLWPKERAVPISMSIGLDEQAAEPCIYALLQPKDRSWVENKEIWKQLISHTTGEVLLEITLTDEQADRTFVVEANYYATLDKADITNKKIKKMYKRYWESRIPIR